MLIAQCRRPLLALLILVGVAGLPLTASASHSWGGYHWARTGDPFPVYLGNNLSGEWAKKQFNNNTNNYLDLVVQAWFDLSPPLDISPYTVVVNPFPATGGATKNVRRCSPTTGKVEVCNTTYGLQRLARPRPDLDQRQSHHAGQRQAQRQLLQHGDLQHARMEKARLVSGGCAHLRPRSSG